MPHPPLLRCLLLFLTIAGNACADSLGDGVFSWKSTGPLQAAADRPDDPCVSVKDPTIVFHEGKWHLFTTIRSEKRSHQIEYSCFADWKDAAAAPRHILRINDGYFCAPQVFFFRPHRKWYLLHQASAADRPVKLQPAFSTTENLADPASWTKTEFLYAAHPATVPGWIDFWIICDAQKAHLFFTSNNGKFWRAETSMTHFPHGWTDPQVVLQADIFEASCTYAMKGKDGFLTLIEAIGNGRRYYKAYLADKLDGAWRPLADSWEKPFAGSKNVSFSGEAWADSISHGELLRTGSDERMEIDPQRLQLLYQGVTDKQMSGKPYGKIPWRLGLLELSSGGDSPKPPGKAAR